jgi:2-polyprenyl-3-methyl-5-hydroxy-6-metoxy-1,4-benzoquinol methylase
MARAFPNGTFVGCDFDEPSIEHATTHAPRVAVGNTRFEIAKAKDFPARDIDLATCFDVLHDLRDPVGGCSPHSPFA